MNWIGCPAVDVVPGNCQARLTSCTCRPGQKFGRTAKGGSCRRSFGACPGRSESHQSATYARPANRPDRTVAP